MDECRCSEPGFCPVFGREQSVRHWEHCSGKCPKERPCKESERVAFRTLWTREALARGLIRLPPLWRRALSLARALGRWAWTGFRRSTMVARRRVICNGCEFRDRERDACLSCGCPLKGGMLLPGKLELSTERCPKGKWPAEA